MKLVNLFDKLIKKIDEMPLWILGFFEAAVVFSFYLIMGDKSVFPFHDQLDENILNYVITARHIGKPGLIAEMMCGVEKSALQPYAIMFLPLYLVFSTRVAFTLSYLIVFFVAFFGMYAFLREMTGSSIIAVIVSGMYALLPFMPVYGTAVAGIPMVLYAIWKLYKKEKIAISYVLLFIYGTSAHLVFTGYCVLGAWVLWIIVAAFRKKLNKAYVGGFFFLLLTFVLVNYELFLELVFKKEGYVSHRSEFVLGSQPFFEAVGDVFLHSAQHAESLHIFLIVPVLLLLVLGSVFRKRLSCQRKLTLYRSLATFSVVIFICLFYGVMRLKPIVDFRNRLDGVLHYFQIDRFYWLLPALWWILFGMSVSLLWDLVKFRSFAVIFSILLLLPSVDLVKESSYLYQSVNQKNNGSEVTGYIDWESYYSEDVMEEIDKAIGKDKSTYRVAHLGMNPTPSLLHGFYTIDGYAGTYSLEYKHKFREIIAGEIDNTPETASYFDDWGSRCYLFNSQSGTSFMNGKDSGVVYSGLRFDVDAMKALGCEYIFSCGEISDYAAEGLSYIGYFSSNTSFWGVYVYGLQ